MVKVCCNLRITLVVHHMITLHLPGDLTLVKMESKRVHDGKGSKQYRKMKKTKKKQKKKKKSHKKCSGAPGALFSCATQTGRRAGGTSAESQRSSPVKPLKSQTGGKNPEKSN